MNKIEEMKALVEKLNQYRDAYYNNAESIVTDHQYDDLCDQLEKMEKETGVILSNSPVHSVGYEVKSKLEKIEHSHLMMSLDKTKDVNILRKFIGDKDSLLMCKMDGLTILLTYEDGELIQAETRGNGVTGEIITHNAKVFENIPMHINQKGHVEIEGEAIITYTDFEKINNLIKHEEDRYKNPRNLASGSVRQLDSKVAAKRHVRFIVWKVPAGMNKLPLMSERFEKARELGFDIVPYIQIFKEQQSLEEAINLLKEKASQLSYPIDGLVAAYNDIAYGLSLGTTDKYPRHSLAFKFYNVEYETVLNAVEWTMGKSGQLTPTAVFEPVEIDGTSVSRASLHNVSIFKRFYLHKGDTVAVYKANQIIPQISRNMTRGYNTGEKFIIPKICPICGEPVSVIKENDSEVLMCMNAGCKGKLLGELNAFVGKKAHDINGLSEATLSLMIQRGVIESSIDLYHLKEKKEQLAYLPKMGAKKIGNLLKAIEDSRNTTLEKFIVGLNIPLIGSRAAKDIAKHEKTRTKELNLTKPINTFIVDAAENYDFTHIEGLGVERNNSIHNYFGENYDYVCALASQFTFQDDIVENITENTSLSGKKFCITGKLHIFANRDELVADIESKGGKVVSGVTKATDYLITNDKNSGSSKNKKASELNIPIISEEEYKNKLN
ncbi:MAG: NAD-dependent DNA ligase adenylation domain [Bacteriophage sp.]|nr:MAG: NAD-dependent DNA ligase adenylation domain [Bacteriophage sp.]